MNQNELKERYSELYEYMAMSKDPKNMKLFGHVMTEMFDWFVANKPDAAEEWLGKLESVKWKNYLTPAEAEKIVAAMEPNAPWNREQWKGAMDKYGFVKEEEPYYNSCALFTKMNSIMSDSSSTLSKYVSGEEMFNVVHDLAVDNLKDRDAKTNIREYFKL